MNQLSEPRRLRQVAMVSGETVGSGSAGTSVLAASAPFAHLCVIPLRSHAGIGRDHQMHVVGHHRVGQHRDGVLPGEVVNVVLQPRITQPRGLVHEAPASPLVR